MLLSVRDVTLRFGGIVALDGVSFEVERGVVSGLIGPNGAGKTTVFNVVTRLYTPDSGEVDLDGTTLLATPPHGVVRRGVARTFQNINLFRTMTVLENVLVGGHALGRRVGERDAFEALEIVGLAERAQPSGRRAPVRDAEADRDRPRADGAADVPAARRARGRAQPRGGRGARRLHPPAPRRAGADDPARRAPHEPRDAGLRPRQRAQLRPEDRVGPAGPGAAPTRP